MKNLSNIKIFTKKHYIESVKDKYFNLEYALIFGLFLGIIIGSYQIYNSIVKND